MLDIEHQQTAVYRLHDGAGRLLYVGMTNSPDLRWRYHALTKAWWPDVRGKSVEWHADRPTASRAEAETIQAEAPLYNCIHAPTSPDDLPLARAREFGNLVDQVRVTSEPRWITRHGRRAAVVVPLTFYERAVKAMSEN